MRKEYIVHCKRYYLSISDFGIPNETQKKIEIPIPISEGKNISLNIVFTNVKERLDGYTFTLETIIESYDIRDDVDYPSLELKDQYSIYLDSVVLFLSRTISPLIFTRLKSDDIYLEEKSTSSPTFMIASINDSSQLLGGISTKKFPSDAVTKVKELLTRLFITYPKTAEKIKNAFHWYAISITRMDPTEALITAFSGIEVILNVYPLEKDSKLEELYNGIKDLACNSHDKDRDKYISFLNENKDRILRPSLKTKFEQFLESVNSPNICEEKKAFDMVYKQRNDLLHGRINRVSDVPLCSSPQYSFDDPLKASQTLLVKCVLYALNNWPST